MRKQEKKGQERRGRRRLGIRDIRTALLPADSRRATYLKVNNNILSEDMIQGIDNLGNWEAIAVRVKAGIGYHGVSSSIPPSDLPTSSGQG